MVARWLVEQGARNLILLSRSGPTGHDAANFLQELEDDGVVVKTPACDVSDAEALQALLEQYLVEMPPIRGCIQASMVLAVRLQSFRPCREFIIPTSNIFCNRTLFSTICLSYPGFLAPLPKLTAHGTYIPFCLPTLNSLCLSRPCVVPLAK